MCKEHERERERESGETGEYKKDDEKRRRGGENMQTLLSMLVASGE